MDGSFNYPPAAGCVFTAISSTSVPLCGNIFGVAAAMLLVIISCISTKRSNTAPLLRVEELIRYAPKTYTFIGQVFDTEGSPTIANVVLYADTAFIFGIATSFYTGQYSFNLSAAEALEVSEFRVSSHGCDTLIRKIDIVSYSDSIVQNDFIMKYKPVDYTVMRAYQAHPGGKLIPNDTIWFKTEGDSIQDAKND